jgi:hypothetical protein
MYRDVGKYIGQVLEGVIDKVSVILVARLI